MPPPCVGDDKLKLRLRLLAQRRPNRIHPGGIRRQERQPSVLQAHDAPETTALQHPAAPAFHD
jgi:hypothetical protein